MKAFKIAQRAYSELSDYHGESTLTKCCEISDAMQTNEEKIVALLHDVLDGGRITMAEIALCGFDKEVLDAVRRLNRRKGEPYKAYLRRIKASELATRVKIAMLDREIDRPVTMPGDIARRDVYQDALIFLLE